MFRISVTELVKELKLENNLIRFVILKGYSSCCLRESASRQKELEEMSAFTREIESGGGRAGRQRPGKDSVYTGRIMGKEASVLLLGFYLGYRDTGRAVNQYGGFRWRTKIEEGHI